MKVVCIDHPNAPHELVCLRCVDISLRDRAREIENIVWQVERLPRFSPGDDEMKKRKDGEWILRDDVLNELAELKADHDFDPPPVREK